MKSEFYTNEELRQFGFKSLGHNVLISDQCIILTPDRISIGNNVRIDAFCFLSGNIELHNNVHVATYCSIIAGEAGVIMEDFTGLAAKVSVYAVSDDYSGACLTNPTVPAKYKKVISSLVTLKKHSIIGANSIVLPGVCLGEGVSIGAMSLVNKTLEPWGIYTGIPAKKIRDRKKDLLNFEDQYKEEFKDVTFKIGDMAFIEKRINEEDVEQFGNVSGDRNPIHFDEQYAEKSIFKKRVVHGILTSSLISNVIGNQLPGEGAIYLSQNLKFIAPVYLNDVVKAIVKVSDIDYEKRILILKTECFANDTRLVLTGEARVKI